MEFSALVQRWKPERSDPSRKASSLVLTMEECFGCLQKHLSCNAYICGSSLLYLNGNLVVLHNIIQANKRFLFRCEDEQPITAFGCAFEGHAELAIATASKKQSKLCVYSEGAGLVYTYSMAPDQVVIDVAVSGTTVVALTSANTLLLRRDPKTHFGSEELKCIPLHCAFTRICELTSGKVLLSGTTGICRVDIRSEPQTHEQIVNGVNALGCVLYENDVCVVALADRICSYKSNKLMECILLSEVNPQEQPFEAFCIIRYSRGFFVGHADKLAISMFLFENEKIKWTATFGLVDKVKGRVLSMHVSSDEMYVAVTGLVGEACTAIGDEIPSRSYIENMLLNLSNLSAERLTSPTLSRPFRNQVEYGTIQQIKGSSVQRCFSLVGCNLIDYSYDEYFRRLVKLNLNESLVDFAVHPLGFQLVCVFKDSLRVYCRLEKDLVDIFKLPLVCSCVQYADNGLLAVAVSSQSQHEVHIIESVKFQIVRTLNCFSCKHPISRIQWGRDSYQLQLFVGSNEFYVVDSLTNRKVAEFYERKKQIVSLFYEETAMQLMACFADGLIVVYGRRGQEQFFSALQELHFKQPVTCMCFVHRTAVFGTASGKVMWSAWPLATSSAQPKISSVFEEVNLSGEPVSHLYIAGLKYLVVATASGTVYVLRLKRRRDNLLIDMEQEFEFSRFKDIVLQSKASLEQTKERLKSLLDKRTSYLSELEEMKKEEQGKFTSEVKDLTEATKEKERASLKETIQTMQINKSTRAELLKQTALLTKKRNMAKDDWAKHADSQLLQVYQEHEIAQKERSKVQAQLTSQLEDMERQLLKNVKFIEEEFQLKLASGQSIMRELRSKLARDQRARRLLGEELQAEERIIKSEQQSEMRRKEQDLNRENGSEKAKLSKLQREIDRYSLRKDFLQGKRKYLENQFHVEETQMKTLRRLKNSLTLELVNLEEATNKREEMIREFTSRNDKLVRFRDVYSYLRVHLQEETETLQKHVAVLSDQIMKVNEELVSILNQDHERNVMLHQGLKTKVRLETMRKDQEVPIVRLQSLIGDLLCRLSHLSPNRPDWTMQAAEILSRLREQMNELQELSSNSRLTALKDNKFLESMEEYNLEQVRNNLTEQKKYLQQNIQRFWSSQRLLEVDLVAVYVKLQAKNSNLITECNILKEKLNKKRKCLNEQTNNLKTGENLLLNIHRSHKEVARSKLPEKSCNLSDWFTVVEKDRRKNSEVPHLRVKTICRYERENTASTDTKCQTLLNICRMNPAERTFRGWTRLPLNETGIQLTEPPSKPSTNHGSRTALGKSRCKLPARRTATASRAPIVNTVPLSELSS